MKHERSHLTFCRLTLWFSPGHNWRFGVFVLSLLTQFFYVKRYMISTGFLCIHCSHF